MFIGRNPSETLDTLRAFHDALTPLAPVIGRHAILIRSGEDTWAPLGTGMFGTGHRRSNEDGEQGWVAILFRLAPREEIAVYANELNGGLNGRTKFARAFQCILGDGLAHAPAHLTPSWHDILLALDEEDLLQAVRSARDIVLGASASIPAMRSSSAA